ncbi:hypothetical protein BJX99DRAFT_230119 [Aspergillus californicus]
MPTIHLRTSSFSQPPRCLLIAFPICVPMTKRWKFLIGWSLVFPICVLIACPVSALNVLFIAKRTNFALG